jgi:hypothetical protein
MQARQRNAGDTHGWLGDLSEEQLLDLACSGAGCRRGHWSNHTVFT